MRRQDNKRKLNDNRPFGPHGMLNMQPGLLGSQASFGNQASFLGAQAGLLGGQVGMMNHGNLLGAQSGLFNNQGNLLGGQAGFLGNRGMMGGNPGALMGNQAGLLRNQMEMLENQNMMGMVGQDLLGNFGNPNLLGMLANRNVNSLIGSQLNGVGALQASLGFGGNQGEAIASLLGEPAGGAENVRSFPLQAGILGAPPEVHGVRPLMPSDDPSLQMGMGGNMMPNKRPFEDDAIPPKFRFQPGGGGGGSGGGGGGNQMSSGSFQGPKQGGNMNRAGVAKGNTCHVCNWSYTSTLMEHMQSFEHRKRVRLVNKGCLLCKTGKFKVYPEYVNHISGAAHKEKKEELNRGLEEKKAAELEKTEKQKPIVEQQIVKETKVKEEPEETEDDEDNDNDMKLEEMAEGDCDSFFKADTMVYDPSVAVGQEHVISVTGYFCKLCRKFYNNETMAKVTHCKSEIHFTKYRESLTLK